MNEGTMSHKGTKKKRQLVMADYQWDTNTPQNQSYMNPKKRSKGADVLNPLTVDFDGDPTTQSVAGNFNIHSGGV